MNKDVLAGMVLAYKERFDSTLSAITDELKELKTDFRKLESDLAISRYVNNQLTNQLILVERKCWANKQYSRRECLEISGIPESSMTKLVTLLSRETRIYLIQCLPGNNRGNKRNIIRKTLPNVRVGISFRDAGLENFVIFI